MTHARAGPAGDSAIALLGAIESLLSAVVADGMIGTRHKSQHGARRAGRREHRVAVVRRHPGDRRDRAHRDERPDRRPHAASRAWCTR